MLNIQASRGWMSILVVFCTLTNQLTKHILS